MFAKYFVEVDKPVERVEEALTRTPPAEWLPGVVQDHATWEDHLMVEVGFAAAGQRFDARGEVTVGPPTRLGTSTVIPLSWKTSGPQPLLPRVEADLEIAPLGPQRTQLSVSARYEPPLAGVGRVLDRALLHRVAEAAVRDFGERVAAIVRSRIVEPPEPVINRKAGGKPAAS